jgi:flagellin-specific chaperone FliS
MTNHDAILESYRNNQVVGANPLERVVMVYDVAIQSCDQKNLERTTRALGVLREALNFEYPEVANRLLAIYLWCSELARKGKWDEAIGILRELRDAWEEANRQLASQLAQPQAQLQPATVPTREATAAYFSAAV